MNESIRRILVIARRDFLAIVRSSGFVVQSLLPVVGIVLLILYFSRPQASGDSVVQGTLWVLDPTGRVAPALDDGLREAIWNAQGEDARRRLADSDAAAPPNESARDRRRRQEAVIAEGMKPRFSIDVEVLPSSMAAEDAVRRMPRFRGFKSPIGLVIVTPDAMSPAQRTPYRWQLFEHVDDLAVAPLSEALRVVVLETRKGQLVRDADERRALTVFDAPPPERVRRPGGALAGGLLSMLVPVVFVGVLVMAMMSGAQLLLAATMEEKSSRVIELLLAAVSTTQLLAGKLLGVGGVVLATVGIALLGGGAALAAVGALDLIDTSSLLGTVAFAMLGFLVYGPILAAIGAVVSDQRDAATLFAPVMLLMLAPIVAAAPLALRPDSAVTTFLSLLPPMSTAVMPLRMSLGADVPAWQLALSFGLGLAAAGAAVFAAGRLFRIGLLVHGKPPDIATLWRWIRQG
jgi:ABC-type Na+ efflux pump permease subunit